MTPFLDKLLRAGGPIATALTRFRKKTELIFLSKRENAKRASGRFETLKRKEMEAERLDRLRNPRNYQGR
jgi:hypothetical protein